MREIKDTQRVEDFCKVWNLAQRLYPMSIKFNINLTVRLHSINILINNIILIKILKIFLM